MPNICDQKSVQSHTSWICENLVTSYLAVLDYLFANKTHKRYDNKISLLFVWFDKIKTHRTYLKVVFDVILNLLNFV